MLSFEVTNQEIKMTGRTPLGDPLVAGSSGEYECQFAFDDSWNELTKTVVFLDTIIGLRIDANNPREVFDAKILEDGKCTIPEAVLRPNSHLRIGVFGSKGEEIKRPTLYSPSMYVKIGASVDGGKIDPSPAVYLQLLNKIEQEGVPEGGAIGQVLIKSSDKNYDTHWADVKTSSYRVIYEAELNKKGALTILDSFKECNDFVINLIVPTVKDSSVLSFDVNSAVFGLTNCLNSFIASSPNTYVIWDFFVTRTEDGKCVGMACFGQSQNAVDFGERVLSIPYVRILSPNNKYIASVYAFNSVVELPIGTKIRIMGK